jgi:hypothetical protein
MTFGSGFVIRSLRASGGVYVIMEMLANRRVQGAIGGSEQDENSQIWQGKSMFLRASLCKFWRRRCSQSHFQAKNCKLWGFDVIEVQPVAVEIH